MTELQWLIKMLTTHKLSATLKDLFIERIGEVEATLSKPVTRPTVQPSTIQAPSMQRIIDETPLIPANIPPPPRPIGIDKETGRPMVATGKGSVGPRKW
jgi:hypothetical protein